MPSRRRTVNASLQNRLVLHRFICREFGYENVDKILERLHDVPPDFDSGGESEYAKALYLNPAHAQISHERFSKYDTNIARHSRRLHMTGEHDRVWKSHQWLALLFTEHYLYRYFNDAERLCTDLNEEKTQDRLTLAMPDYTEDDLSTIAFQSATGSGKTLLMHAHILQYRHYLKHAGKRLNNIILLTPNEQMSAQHRSELRTSGLDARLFSGDTGTDLLAPVEIIDLNKLAEKKGIKRVSIKDFESNNLVLVDEGHLGASGKVWREHRKELSRDGFTFEYSATFNQVTGKDEDMLNAYGKCLLFDYSYHRFHGAGYGKDYTISNLPQGAENENSKMYLLGCLLTFYQQCRLWRDKHVKWMAFNLARPLWVFLGKTVTGSSTADKETRSDVVLILEFLGWVLANGDQIRPMITRILAGESGLTDDAGKDYFAGRFPHLPQSGEDLYADLCETLFHGAGPLHVVYLTAGEGELHLRTADNAPFGVINVGDSATFYKLLTQDPHPDLKVEREMGFTERLFNKVDETDSTINMVIGARRFVAGWNSWRVSTMGLMHVGVGEGPEIIQMFGRGVRLKGWNMSLKRHHKSGAGDELPRDTAGLDELETLYIFGLRANYMQTFRDLLQREGMRVERETIRLPTTWNFGKKFDLKLIRIEGNQKFASSAERPVLPNPNGNLVVRLDLYSQLQAVASDEARKARNVSDQQKINFEITPFVPFFNRARIYDKLLVRKRQKGWHNLAIERETVDALLENPDWYELLMPPKQEDVKSFADVRRLEDVAVDLITEYANDFWRKRRRKWESNNIEVVTLNRKDDNNVGEYRITVDAKEKKLIEAIHHLKANVRERYFSSLKLGVIMAGTHAYEPLLYADEDCKVTVTVQPVPLNKNEKKLVEGLDELATNRDPCLQDRELYLIRNLSRGRGAGSRFSTTLAITPTSSSGSRTATANTLSSSIQKAWFGTARKNVRKCGCIQRSRKLKQKCMKPTPTYICTPTSCPSRRRIRSATKNVPGANGRRKASIS